MGEETEAPPAGGDSGSSEKVFRLDEVKQHSTPDSLWIIINNKVYDITSFAYEHPGGEEILFEHGGKDGSKDFEDVGHSADARELMQKYFIGDMHPDDHTAPVAANTGMWNVKSEDSDSWLTFSTFLFALGVGAVSLIAYKFIL